MTFLGSCSKRLWTALAKLIVWCATSRLHRHIHRQRNPSSHACFSVTGKLRTAFQENHYGCCKG